MPSLASAKTDQILSIELQKQAQLQLNKLYEHAKIVITKNSQSVLFQRLMRAELKCPQLLFNQRGKVAASAVLQKNLIKLNPILFSENKEYFLQQVIAHELAHILVFQLYSKRVRPHGEEWQGIMNSVFDLPASVTHKLDVSSLPSKTFTYKCLCQSVELSIVRHNKVLRGTQSYVCKRCEGRLKHTKKDF